MTLALVSLAPLMSAVLALMFRRTAGWVHLGGVLLALLALLLCTPGSTLDGAWLSVAGLSVTAGLGLEPLQRWMALLVLLVALPVSLYAVADPEVEGRGRSRFFFALSLFVTAMLTLVLSRSTLLLYAGWEGVGLASYLLIGFSLEEDAPRRAARRAFLMTRLGDLGLLLGLLLLLLAAGTTELPALLSRVAALPAGTVTAAALLMLLGVVGKSAQLPLSVWLPDAMAGPTPVSALLHSATMVAAGVYLLLRLEPLYAAAPAALGVIAALGGGTALFAALTATAQSDLKRVLAWSTVSQLGEMLFAFGLGVPYAAAFHLGVQALFKSGLFLAAGSVQRAAGTRELPRLGGLMRAMPLTAAAFALGALTLAGVPPLGAFWSEDAILGAAAARSVWAALLLLLLVGLAGAYIGRAGAATFLGQPRERHAGARDPGPALAWPALLLAALGAAGGLVAFTLPFAGGPATPWGWTLLSALAALLGLTGGVLDGVRRGAAPVLCGWTAALPHSLDALTHAAGRFPLTLAAGVERLERGLDAAARGLATSALAVSRGVSGGERALGNGARSVGLGVRGASRRGQGLEAVLDGSACRLGQFTLRSADLSERAEAHGFSGSGDWLAARLGRLGERTQRLESGLLYHYTLILLAAAALIAALGFILVTL